MRPWRGNSQYNRRRAARRETAAQAAF